MVHSVMVDDSTLWGIRIDRAITESSNIVPKRLGGDAFESAVTVLFSCRSIG